MNVLFSVMQMNQESFIMCLWGDIWTFDIAHALGLGTQHWALIIVRVCV